MGGEPDPGIFFFFFFCGLFLFLKFGSEVSICVVYVNCCYVVVFVFVCETLRVLFCGFGVLIVKPFTLGLKKFGFCFVFQ